MNDGIIGTWSYRAGDWYAVFGANTTLLLPASERERVATLWALVDGGADFTQVLDGLLASGLSTLQGFVLVGADVGPTRILLRGDGVRASLTTADETVELEGAGSTTWVERTVDDVTLLAVTLGDEVAGPDFAIDGGLVRVSRIDLPPAGQLAADAEVATVLPPGVVIEPETDSEPDTAPQPVAEPEASLRSMKSPRPTSRRRSWPRPRRKCSRRRWPRRKRPPNRRRRPPTTCSRGPKRSNRRRHPRCRRPIRPPPRSRCRHLRRTSATCRRRPRRSPDPGATVGSSTEAPPPPPPPPPPGAGDSDHDGLTQTGVNTDEFAREQPGIPGQPMAPSVTRPVAKLIISNGETIDVDRVVLIGRAPEARRFTSTEQPTLITVPSPMHEISSTHVEVRPGSGADHGSAVVTDMGSTNGTVLVQPGLPPEDLKPGIAVQLIPGAIINLGDGLTIQVARP